MIAKLFALLSSLTLGVSALLAPFSGQALPPTPQPPAAEPLASDPPVSQPPAQNAARLRAFLKGRLQDRLQDFLPARPGNWPYRGDRLLRANLVLATVSSAGLTPVQVLEQLQAGQSIAAIAQGAGVTSDDVLAVYDQTVEYIFDQAVEKARLPQSLAQARLDWYQSAARLMVDQPRLAPAYPGLHELHVTLLAAAARVGGLTRADLRSDLQACQTVDQILSARGHTGQEAVEAAMGRIDGWLERLVAAGKLSADQRTAWESGIRSALQKMVSVPGLHIAGVQCSA